MGINKLKTIPLLLLLFAPFGAILFLSLVREWIYPDLLHSSIYFGHWRQFFDGHSALTRPLVTSLVLAITVSMIATVFGYYMSKQIVFYYRKPRLIYWAFYPYLIAPIVLAAMLQYYFVRLGFSGSIWGVLLAQSLFILPYSVILMSTFWTAKVRKLIFQAETLGADKMQINRKLLWHLARPWLLLCAAQSFLISWFEYGLTYLIGVGKVQSLTISVMHYIQEANTHQAALVSCILVAPLLIIFIILFIASKLVNSL